MIYTNKIQKAVSFAVKTHEIHQKQKRKGKDIPYIIHPLIVGMILAKIGAEEEVIIAGILHDVIEDSAPENKVAKSILEKEFGKRVADIVDFVSEESKEVPREIRKRNALKRVEEYTQDALLVKSADAIENLSEVIEDYQKDGEAVFNRFSAPKDEFIQDYLMTIAAIEKRWPQNVFLKDLKTAVGKIKQFSGT